MNDKPVIYLTQEERAMCEQFANQNYRKLNPKWQKSPEVHKRNTYIGKLADLAYYKFVNNNPELGIKLSGARTVFSLNSHHFVTKKGQTMKVASASEPKHTKIFIPEDQYLEIKCDLYAGVRILPCRMQVRIHGYCEYKDLKYEKWIKLPYDAYGATLSSLKPTEQLNFEQQAFF